MTTSYVYTADRLTSFGGTTIAYNAIGCPTTYDGKTATWTKGRLTKLSSGTLETGLKNYTYTYNGFGQRVAQNYSYVRSLTDDQTVVSGELTASSKQYFYDHAGRLISEEVSKTYRGEGTTTERIVFLYDESSIIGMEYTVGSTASTYYFHRNLLGDVIGIYDTSGTLVAKYLYDAWGNCTISSETTNDALAHANPIRYRGYYYDDDTGLYYLNARYYSPKWRRFISPNDASCLDPKSVNGLNLYCYCGNNPIMFISGQSNFDVAVGELNWVESAAVAVSVEKIRFRRKLYRKNYIHNLDVERNSTRPTHNQIVFWQSEMTDSFMYGKYHAYWNACETIAIHNAKVLLGMDSTLSQTMLDCQNAGIMIGNGFFGSNPLGIGSVLQDYGIRYSFVGRKGMTKPGVYIISYWTGVPLHSPLHTIAVEYDGSRYTAYNDGETKPGGTIIDPADYRWRFIIGYYLEG